MIFQCSFPAAIVKGLVEHGDGTAYFGSLLGYEAHMAEAKHLGWVGKDGKTVTEAGKTLYEREHLDELPQQYGSRAYMWSWSTLRGVVQVVTEEHACVAVGMPPYRCTCDASNLHDGTWYLNRLFVDESVRRMGVGKELLARMTRILQGRGILIVDPGGYGSDPAKLRRWYRRQGFKNTPMKGRLRFDLGEP